MANYYWRGKTGAAIPAGISGTTYSLWLAATALTASNFVRTQGIGSPVQGATIMPTGSDYVYFGERYPLPGTTWSGGLTTLAHSPCLNSNAATLTAALVQNGPFSNLTQGPLPLYGGSPQDTSPLIGSLSRVGGSIYGNSYVAETQSYSGSTLTGTPLKISAPLIKILSSSYHQGQLGGYDINIEGSGTISCESNFYPAVGLMSTERAMHPWLEWSNIRIKGTVNRIQSTPSWIGGKLTLHTAIDMSASTFHSTSGFSMGTQFPVSLKGQWDEVKIEKSASVPSINIAPYYSIDDSTSGVTPLYHIACSVPGRLGEMDGIVAQQDKRAATIVIESAVKATGITGTWLPKFYNVILGDHSIGNESYTTDYLFRTTGVNSGSPTISLRGTVANLQDFILECGHLRLDPTNETGNSGVICTNGLHRSSRGISFSSMTPSQQLQSWNIVKGNSGHGLRIIGALALDNVEFPYTESGEGTRILSLMTTPYPYPADTGNPLLDGNENTKSEDKENDKTYMPIGTINLSKKVSAITAKLTIQQLYESKEE